MIEIYLFFWPLLNRQNCVEGKVDLFFWLYFLFLFLFFFFGWKGRSFFLFPSPLY